jgi:hypothetical protein
VIYGKKLFDAFGDCHSRENGNPAIQPIPRSGQIALSVSLHEGCCIDWIPVSTEITIQ